MAEPRAAAALTWADVGDSREAVCCWLPGLDYTRPAFGPCTAPGVPAASCKVVYAEDLEGNDNQLDDPNQELHGTNVAGVITSELGAPHTAALQLCHAWPRLAG